MLPTHPPALRKALTLSSPRCARFHMHVQEAMVQVHTVAIDNQLSQLWHAAGIALALNYTLVLPQFRCFCAKNW